MIRAVQPKDTSAICTIYNYYIENTVITFEEETLDNPTMAKRITEYTENFPWLVFEENDRILGYCYAAKYGKRSAYRFSVEVSVYINKDAHRRGIGSLLYQELIKLLKHKDVHLLVAGIALPNESSVGIHEKLGFRKVAHFHEIGFKFNQWIDVGYWERHI